MKKFRSSFFLMVVAASLLLVFASACTVKTPDFIFTITTQEDTTFGSSTILVQWSSPDGLQHSYSCKLNDLAPVIVNENQVSFEDLTAGDHVVKIRPVDIAGPEQTFNFSVNLAGPNVTVKATERDRPSEDKSGVQPFARNTLITWEYDLNNVGINRVAFRVNSAGREYMKLDNAGGYTMVPSRNDAWIELDPDQRQFYVSDHRAVVNGVEYDLFNMGEDYVIYVQGGNSEGTLGGLSYVSFRLDERYTDENTPIVRISKIETTGPTASASATIKFTIKADNVKNFCAEDIHNYYGPDTSRNNRLMLLQLGVNFVTPTSDATDLIMLSDVTWTHFAQGYNDYNGIKTDPSTNKTHIYKGLVRSADTTAGTDTVAVIEYAVDESLAGEIIGYGLNTTGSYVRDIENRTIDGIQFDHFTYALGIPASAPADSQ